MHDDMVRDNIKYRIERIVAFGIAFDKSPEEIADGVLAAMREPTEAMLQAAAEHPGQQNHADIWQAMIAAALPRDQARTGHRPDPDAISPAGGACD